MGFTACPGVRGLGKQVPGQSRHEFDTLYDTDRATHLLDGPVLEHKVVGAAAASWPWRNWTFYTRVKLGAAFNGLALETAGDAGTNILRPQAGEHAPIYAWTLGASYLWKVGARRAARAAR